MYFLVLEVQPTLAHPEHASVEGAYATCFVQAATADQAERLTRAMLTDDAWEVLTVEESPRWIDGVELEGNAASQELYEQAQIDGVAITLHRWPVGASEEP